MFHSGITYGRIFPVVFAYSFFFSVSHEIEIKTKQGILDGFEMESRNGTTFYAFLGIPYAKPPVGNLRFQPPQPADSWEGVRDATEAPPACIQRELVFAVDIALTGQEDCLYLNVFTPKDIKSPLPVMVWIHGGGFFEGEGSIYGPTYLLENQIILVTINYRLGALGFLSAGDEVLPGNNGMKDQVAALKWVQEYIRDFGGDPQQVTIAGESAGGSSVHFHMFSPLSKGLFQRAISQSGTALALWARLTPAMARRRFVTFGILAGCSPVPTQVLVDCLRKIPAEEIVLITQKYYVWDLEPQLIFTVVVEPENATNAFLTQNPWSLNTPILHDVPWMIGMTSGEGVIKAARYLANGGKLVNDLNENFKRYIPLILAYIYYLKPDDVEKTSEKLKSYYFKDQKLSLETEKGLADLITDSYFLYDHIEAIDRHPSKPYVYLYDHKGEITVSDFTGDGKCCKSLGASHADDLFNLFQLPVSPSNMLPEDLSVSERMIKYWINFIYTGKPTSDDSWKISKSPEIDYWHIETKSDSMKTGLQHDRYLFWKNLKAHPLDVFSKE